MTTAQDIQTIKQRVDLLAKARRIVNENYLKQKLQAQEKWRQDSHHLWVTQGILLPYPASFEYPTEQEIVDKALELYNTAKEKGEIKEKPAESPKETTPWEMYLTPETIKAVEPEQEQEQEQEPLVRPDVKPIHGPVPIDPTPEPIVEPESHATPELTLDQLAEKEKQNSKLRALLAQFVTTAKNLDSTHTKEIESDTQ